MDRVVRDPAVREQRITVTVPDEPARVAVDPRRLLIELRTDDNSAEVKKGQHRQALRSALQ